MGLVGRQFARPSGPVGRMVGRFMARNNGAFNQWVVAEAIDLMPPRRIVEIGPGPGVGTMALLEAAPEATLTAVEPSPAMIRQLLRRNRGAVAAGRLQALNKEVSEMAASGDVDLVVAVHVLYFWTAPESEIAHIAALLRPGGRVAIGYQLERDMPGAARRDFPASGHRLYDSDEEIAHLMSHAGVHPLPVRVFGSGDRPSGRLMLGLKVNP